MHKELRSLYEQIAHDTDVRVVVVTGAGRAFCVGADFAQMQENLAAGGYPDGRPDMLSDGADIARGILRVRQPMIAAVNGHALGIGATLALFCDIVYMSSAARIGDPHVQAGLVAGDGGCVLWPMLLGINRAKEYLMTGDLLSADDAERLGLVNHVVAPEALDETAMAMAKRLAAGPMHAIQFNKRLVNKMLEDQVSRLYDLALGVRVRHLRHRRSPRGGRGLSRQARPDVRLTPTPRVRAVLRFLSGPVLAHYVVEVRMMRSPR